MNKINRIVTTPSQTVGPFFRNYLRFNLNKSLLNGKNNKFKKKYAITINCSLKDKFNKIIKDGFIEYYQSSNFNNKMKY